MLATIRLFGPEIAKAKKFIKEHPTLTACAVTAVVASKLTYNVTTDRIVDQIAEYFYEVGHESGILLAENTILREFVNENELADELRQYLVSLNMN